MASFLVSRAFPARDTSSRAFTDPGMVISGLSSGACLEQPEQAGHDVRDIRREAG